MLKLAQNKYENIRELFNDNYPNLSLVFALIEQYIPGQIWVDNENKPSWCMLITDAPYCFIKGEIDEAAFAECINLVKQKPMLKLAIEANSALDITQFGLVPVARRQYRYKNIHNKIPVYENNSGYLIKPIDMDIYNLCQWKSLMTNLYGSAENYIKNGIGFVLWDTKKQMIASESHGIPSKEFIEVGTITHEDYRRQNLSTILCNHLIRFAIEKNLKPVWSCDESNFNSWRVAEKEGMDELIKYTFYSWK